MIIGYIAVFGMTLYDSKSDKDEKIVEEYKRLLGRNPKSALGKVSESKEAVAG